jgi:4-aminobutyrate aminotransferase-like enzyme/Ser/Thr protein kinase RdoA (MazF antagonist)
VLALRTAPPSFGAIESERVARELYGLAVTSHPLPGERDCNFRLITADSREFVLKILALGSDAEGVDCLVRVLDHLAEQDPGLPVPRLLPTPQGEATGWFSRDGTDYATCLVGFLPGRLMRELPAGGALLQEVGGTLARLDGALQGFFHPSLNRRLAWDVRRLPDLAEHIGHLAPALRPRVEAVTEAFRACLPRLRGLRSQAIHGDCHGANLLIDPAAQSVSGILDFGDMIHAPLIFEPAVAMSELLTEGLAPLESIGAVLRGFAQLRAPLPEEVELLFDIVTARHAVTLLVHAWRAQHDPVGARALSGSAAHAARSLESLLTTGRGPLTDSWHDAAGTRPRGAARTAAPASESAPAGASRPADAPQRVDLERRQRLMGAGAELFYDTPLHLVRGAGVWLYDPEGRRYLDVYNNVPHVGHAHPTVVAAIQKQTAILATHTRYLHGNILDYAEQLTARLPAHLDTCIFVNSGSEANDVAWRLARMASGNDGGLVMNCAYHGITDTVAALTPSTRQIFDPRVAILAPPPEGLQAGDALSPAQREATVQDAQRAIAELRARGHGPAAFFLDTAITSSGIFDPPAAWATTLCESLRPAGCLIVADEVQYGLGRCGSHFWGFERRGLVPDIVTLGKPVANGYPMGVVIARRELIEAFQAKFGFFSTFGGNAVAAAAALAVFKVLDAEQLVANAAATGGYVREQLEAVAARHACLGRVRGTGLLQGLEVLNGDGSPSRKRCKRIINRLAADFGILIGYEGPHASFLKLRPPMPFRREHADMLARAIDEAATAVDASAD